MPFKLGGAKVVPTPGVVGCVRNSPFVHSKPITTILHVSFWSSSLQYTTDMSQWVSSTPRGVEEKEEIVYSCCARWKPGISKHPQDYYGGSLSLPACASSQTQPCRCTGVLRSHLIPRDCFHWTLPGIVLGLLLAKSKPNPNFTTRTSN